MLVFWKPFDRFRAGNLSLVIVFYWTGIRRSKIALIDTQRLGRAEYRNLDNWPSWYKSGDP
jgi:hypothetical protein